jgi:hypothetical protein
MRIKSPGVVGVKLPEVTVVVGLPRSECPALPSTGLERATLLNSQHAAAMYVLLVVK